MERLEFFEALARIGRAVDSPERIRILDALCNASRTVAELSEATDLPVKTVSHHLQILKREGILSSVKEGRHCKYSVSCHGVKDFLGELKEFASEVLPEIRLHVSELESRRKSTALDERSQARSVVIDLRPIEEYEEAHLPGAVAVPPGKLDAFAEKTPRAVLVRTYCRDRFCTVADDAVDYLRRKGFRASRLSEGPLK